MYALPKTISCIELTDQLARAINSWSVQLRENQRLINEFGRKFAQRPLDNQGTFNLEDAGLRTDASFTAEIKEREDGLEPILHFTLKAGPGHRCVDAFYAALTTKEPGIEVTEYVPGSKVTFTFDPSMRR